MLFSNQYNQILRPSKAIYKVKNSKFVAYAFIVFDILEIDKLLNQVKKMKMELIIIVMHMY